MANTFFFFFLVVTTLCCLPKSRATNTTDDQTTLLVFKSYINPSSTFLDQNWSTATSVCNWIGVTCGSRHRRVTSLSLPNMQLVGTIPAQLGNLSFLVELNIFNNSFYGELPEELFGLRRLTNLTASMNNFSGSIPLSLFNCFNLQTLDLSDNKFSGVIPKEIGKLEVLSVLTLGGNNLEGSLPKEMCNLTMLSLLALSNNNLTGTIPQEIGHLKKLQLLVLSVNSLSGSIPREIFNISTLQYIYLPNNHLSGILPPTMGQNLPSLLRLFLNYNYLTGRIPESITNASKLEVISLEYNRFVGPIPNSFGNLQNLTCLHLFDNSLTSDSPQELSFITSLTNCRYLQDFSVTNNPLDAALPISIGNFSTNLKRIYLSSCGIKGAIPNEIGNLSNLVSLYLNDNDLSGYGQETFHGMQNLQGLYLGTNKLRGFLPSSLCGLHSLNTLSLGQNEFSGPMLDCIGNLKSLRNINFSSNRLSSSIPITMWNLRDLLSLDLSSNSFTGSLPAEVGNLKMAISEINLSNNQFTGSIPSEFGTMQSLSMLSLANNEFQGHIPQSFDGMVNIEWLDLSNNQLSGGIPMSLEKLRLLKYFNVSFNKLSGQIPSEGPFKNLSYLSFVPNEALCGNPQFHVPLCRSRKRRLKLVIVFPIVFSSLIVGMLLVILWAMRRKRKEIAVKSDSPKHVAFARFSYQQIHQATDGFSQENLLGAGSFGSVYKAIFQSGSVYAVKVFNLQKKDACKSFETECEVLGSLRHRNLTKVISACSSIDFKALVLEYMQNGSLEDWLYSDAYFLDIMQRLDIMIDVAAALEYLHHEGFKPVIHCDLKPSNILIDEDMVGHVTDFGITKLLGEEESSVHTTTLATLGYIAPEYGAQGHVSSASDVYSYGILLMETFTGKRPSDPMFDGDLNLRSWISALAPEQLTEVVDSNLMCANEKHFTTHEVQCVSSIIDLALRCTVESPRDRMTTKDVLNTLKDTKIRFATKLL